MAKINEIKEQRIVVASVGEFANSLQQIATMRMVTLRKAVLASRPFVEESMIILKELKREWKRKLIKELKKIDKKISIPKIDKQAIIVVSSYQGLCGSYNTEIIKRINKVVPRYPDADYFVIGSKGQDYYRKLLLKNDKLHYYPYDIPENVQIDDLRNLISLFNYYDDIYLIYSKYINTATREIVFLELSGSSIAEEIEKEIEIENEKAEEPIENFKFVFEPDLKELIESVTEKLRYSLFKQQILDSKLSLYSAQMVAMQTASDNAKTLLEDLQMEYNKARRKQIDKKIQEVQAGRALWAD